VVIGDALWPLLAILGVSWVVSSHGEILVVLRYVASLVFLVMGVLLIRHAGAAISMAVPFAGNLVFALFVDRARRTLSSPTVLRRTNRIAGGLLILVGLVIPFT